MNGQHEDRIHHLRSAFARAGHEPVDAVTFARGVLATTQREIRRQLAEQGFVAARLLAVLDVQLADPADVDAATIAGYVNHGRWIAKCECGGVEYVDLEGGLFMCCSCWNVEYGHRWRVVAVPDQQRRAAIEKALLARPDPARRNWHPDESVEYLEVENAHHHVTAGVS